MTKYQMHAAECLEKLKAAVHEVLRSKRMLRYEQDVVYLPYVEDGMEYIKVMLYIDNKYGDMEFDHDLWVHPLPHTKGWRSWMDSDTDDRNIGYLVKNLEHDLARDVCGAEMSRVLDKDMQSAISAFLDARDRDKVMVLETVDDRRLFMRFGDHFNENVWDIKDYDFDPMETGAGPEYEFNVPHYRRYPCVYLSDTVRAMNVNGHYRACKVSCLEGLFEDPESEDDERWGKWYSMRDSEKLVFEDVPGFFYSNNRPVSYKILDLPQEKYLDSFARDYMLKEFSYLVEDIEDSDGTIAKRYEECKAYNPEAFENWKDYFCRKRCMIDSGAGCGSNCCKQRVVQFVEYQYHYYDIKPVSKEAKAE